MQERIMTTSISNDVKKIDKAIKNGAEILLVIVDAKKYVKTSIEILKYLTERAEGIFVTLNRPYISVKKLMEKEGIDINKILFIDCITRQIGGEEIDTEKCIYLNSPDPTQMQVAIENAMNMITAENRFLYLDSLSTISLYKSFETLLKFFKIYKIPNREDKG